MFSASIKSKDILNGTLTVIVTFTNGDQTFNEEFRTTTASDDTWVTSVVGSRLRQLEALYSVADSISVGRLEIPPVPEDADKL